MSNNTPTPPTTKPASSPPTCHEAPFPLALLVAVFMTEGLFSASIFHEKRVGGGVGAGGL